MTALSISSSTPVAAPAAGVAPTIAKPSEGVTTANAVALAGDEDLVSLLGVPSGAGATYNAAGLFNSIANAGVAATPATTPAAPQSLDQQLSNAIGAPASAGPLDALAASQPTGSVDQNANYATILKATPSAASALIADSFNQGIVSTISTYA